MTENRSKGIGKALMVSAVNYLSDRGVAVAEVETQFYRTARGLDFAFTLPLLTFELMGSIFDNANSHV